MENFVGLRKLGEVFEDAPKDKVIIGGDLDSISSGIIMNKIYGSKVVGIFDTELLITQEDLDLKDALFLDIEILKEGYYSIGNHVNTIHKSFFNDSTYNDRTDLCMNANLANKISAGNKQYCKKFPFGTNSLLLALIELDGVDLTDYFDYATLQRIVAISDGTLNSMFNCRYHTNTIDWASTFFKGTTVSRNILTPLFNLSAFEKFKLENSAAYNGKTKMKVSRSKYKEDLIPYIRHCHSIMKADFDLEQWFLGKNYSEHVLSTDSTDTTKYRNMHLYTNGSKMITSNVKNAQNMFFSVDKDEVF